MPGPSEFIIFCKFNQKREVVSKALDNLRAMSGITEPLVLIILDNVFLDTPMVDDNSVIVRDNGFR